MKDKISKGLAILDFRILMTLRENQEYSIHGGSIEVVFIFFFRHFMYIFITSTENILCEQYAVVWPDRMPRAQRYDVQLKTTADGVNFLKKNPDTNKNKNWHRT